MSVREGDHLTTALCPGSFDPPTNGHLDVIYRSLEIFERVVVGVVHNPSKTPFLPAEERVALLADLVEGRAEVEAFEGLLVDFARTKSVDVVVKGVRVVSDFDYELQMAQMNWTLAGTETLLIPSNPQWGYLSSSLVREIARLGGDVDSLVPPNVAKALKERL
jgi:pantetheine-phosphate adenylyltransferase